MIQLDRIGAWASTNGTTAAAAGCAQRMQAGGYGAPGLPESCGRTAAKQSGDRLLLGLGVFHDPLVAGLHGHIEPRRTATAALGLNA